MVMGDRMELRRVLTNLIGNAIKFTDTGSVTVRILEHQNLPVASALNTPESWVTIEVEDTGAGIPLEEQSIIFERFRMGKHKRADSGLGLYLSRCIVEAHGGTITVSSEVGKGSLFSVELPVFTEADSRK
jgi:signal transduction histidine kinase